MKCEQFLVALDLHSPRAPNDAMLSHMQGCADCRAACDIHLHMTAQLAGVELPPAPDGMEAVIAARIDALVRQKSAPVHVVNSAPERWAWVTAAVGEGIFLVANVSLFSADNWQPGTLTEHLLPGLFSDRLMQMLTNPVFVPESGAMTLGVMLVMTGLFSLAGRPA
jgi:hypothetical protein